MPPKKRPAKDTTYKPSKKTKTDNVDNDEVEDDNEDDEEEEEEEEDSSVRVAPENPPVWSGMVAKNGNKADRGMQKSSVTVKLRSNQTIGRLRSRKYDASYKAGWAIQSNGYKAKKSCTNCLKGKGPFKHCKGYKPQSKKSCGNCILNRDKCYNGHFIHVQPPRSARSRLGNKVKGKGKAKADVVEEEEEEDDDDEEEWEGIDPPTDLPKDFDPFDSDDDDSGPPIPLGRRGVAVFHGRD